MLKKETPVRSHSGNFRGTNTSNKKYLSIDFKHRCAYCDDLDAISGGYKTFHVEHFASKEKFPTLEFTYENLLYACPFCNCSKNDDGTIVHKTSLGEYMFNHLNLGLLRHSLIYNVDKLQNKH